MFTKSKAMTVVVGIAAVSFVCSVILYPDQAFQSSLVGLSIWWNIVFPAMLPFLIASEILRAYGFAHYLGVLLEPAMRLLFNIPGIGGWAIAMGVTAGYPAGAEVTGKLRKQQLITRYEGERMLSLSHVSSPIFMMSVVAVGFFHNPSLGVFIISIHYLSAFITGLIMRFHTGTDELSLLPAAVPAELTRKKPILIRSYQAMLNARYQDGRTLGKLLGDAVSSSIQTLMVIGGFIMIFSVIMQVFTLTGFTYVLFTGMQRMASFFGVGLAYFPQSISGLLEINLGAYGVSKSPLAIPLVWQASILGGMLAWSGFSVHAQVRSLTDSTDLRYAPFFISRCIHIALAFMMTFGLWQPFVSIMTKINPDFISLLLSNFRKFVE